MPCAGLQPVAAAEDSKTMRSSALVTDTNTCTHLENERALDLALTGCQQMSQQMSPLPHALQGRRLSEMGQTWTGWLVTCALRCVCCCWRGSKPTVATIKPFTSCVTQQERFRHETNLHRVAGHTCPAMLEKQQANSCHNRALYFMRRTAGTLQKRDKPAQGSWQHMPWVVLQTFAAARDQLAGWWCKSPLH